MQTRRLLHRAALLAAAFSASPLLAVPTEMTTYIGAASGNWEDGENWTGFWPSGPQSDLARQAWAVVDGNAGQASTVDIHTSFDVRALEVGSNDMVRLTDGARLGILDLDAPSGAAVLVNFGTIALTGTTAFTDLAITTQSPTTILTTVGGNGTITLGGPKNRIFNPNLLAAPVILHMSGSNRVVGSGMVGHVNAKLLLQNVNSRFIASGGTLTLQFGGSSLNGNAGTFSALAGGTLVLQDTFIKNGIPFGQPSSRGTFNPSAGGAAVITGSQVWYHNFAGPGVIYLGNLDGTSSNNELFNVDMLVGANVELLGNCTTTILSTQQSGTMRCRPGSKAVLGSGSGFTETLPNHGTIILEQGPDIGSGGAVIQLNSPTVTLGGSGTVTTNLNSGFLLPKILRTNPTDTLINYNNVIGRMWVETNIDNYGVFDSGGNGQGMLLGSSVPTSPTSTLNRPTGVIRTRDLSQMVIAGNSTFTNLGSVTVENGGSLVISTGAIASGNGFANDGWVINFGSMSLSFMNGPSGSLDFRGGSASSLLGVVRQRELRMESGTLEIVTNGLSSGTSRVESLNFVGGLATTACLDLTNNYMIVDYTGASPIATIRGLLSLGYNGGNWNGVGIRSKTAANSPTLLDGIGYAEATSIFTSFPANFGGLSVDGSSVLTRWTLLGDCNLDGTVNISDFSQLGANFNVAGFWFQGDCNYDGTVTIGDFSLLASNFNNTLPPINPAPLPDARFVPEPATAAVLLLLCTLRHRCERRRRIVA